jgi:adenosylhomocysteine nucleosidase
MIAIIGAMDLELETLLNALENREIHTIADKTFHVGSIAQHDVVIAKSGIGKVNAAMTASMLIIKYKPEYLINIGVAGGVKPTQIGDIVVASGICYSDVSLEAIDRLPFGKMGTDPLIVEPDQPLRNRVVSILTKQNIHFHQGLVASGDSFVVCRAFLKPIENVVGPVLACEMEGMAIAIVCHKFMVPFVSLRGISDVVDSSDQEETYRISVDDIAKKTAALALAILQN